MIQLIAILVIQTEMKLKMTISLLKKWLYINATINMYKNDHIKMYKINST